MISTRSVTYLLKLQMDPIPFHKIELKIEVEEVHKYNFIYEEEDITSHSQDIYEATVNGIARTEDELKQFIDLNAVENAVRDFIGDNFDDLKVGFSLPIWSSDASLTVEGVEGSTEPTYEPDPLY